jgi:hypothetical protein
MMVRVSVVIAFLVAPCLTRPVVAAGDDFAVFRAAVAEYAAVRARTDAALPPRAPEADPARIAAASDRLADALCRARATATIGDVFDLDTAVALRQRIQRTMDEYHLRPADLMDDPDGEKRPRPFVHARFEWDGAAAVPAPLIDALPALPAMLQYRFVGRDLVLVDIDASLIIDVLRDAVPVVPSQILALYNSEAASLIP